jgi:hypothetical protein
MFASISLIVLVILVFWLKFRIAPDIVTRLFLGGWLIFLVLGVLGGVVLPAKPVETHVLTASGWWMLSERWALAQTAFWMFFFLIYRFHKLFFGRTISNPLALFQFGLFAVGNLLILIARTGAALVQTVPQSVDYQNSLDIWNTVSAVGYLTVLISLIVFVAIIGQGLRRRHK